MRKEGVWVNSVYSAKSPRVATIGNNCTIAININVWLTCNIWVVVLRVTLCLGMLWVYVDSGLRLEMPDDLGNSLQTPLVTNTHHTLSWNGQNGKIQGFK